MLCRNQDVLQSYWVSHIIAKCAMTCAFLHIVIHAHLHMCKPCDVKNILENEYEEVYLALCFVAVVETLISCTKIICLTKKGGQNVYLAIC